MILTFIANFWRPKRNHFADLRIDATPLWVCFENVHLNNATPVLVILYLNFFLTTNSIYDYEIMTNLEKDIIAIILATTVTVLVYLFKWFYVSYLCICTCTLTKMGSYCIFNFVTFKKLSQKHLFINKYLLSY